MGTPNQRYLDRDSPDQKNYLNRIAPTTTKPLPTTNTATMGAKDVLSRKAGVIYGEDVKALFKHAQKENYAIPAINCTSSSTVVASLEAAKVAQAPIILQVSQGGAAYFCGKGIDNKDQSASISGAIAAAHYIRAVAPAYGVNNESVDNASLYTQPEDIHNIYKTLMPISPYFSIAAGFGNVHGVYKPGNVKLHPELLSKHQQYVAEKEGIKDDKKPVFLVFHGGSGSGKQEYLDAISHGVCKVNLDTDLQYAYTEGIRDYMLKNKDYLMTQVGNPDGADKPNKKFYDPRVWVREGEKTMTKRVAVALEDFNSANKL